jgi:hypothetical protein
MSPGPIRPAVLALLAAASILLGSDTAGAACNRANVCSFADVATCCPGATCTLDGTITLSGPTCDLDFSGHNVVLTGTLVVGSTTVSIEAASFSISGAGLVDAHGTNPADGGNVTITTTDGGASSVSLTGNAQSGFLLTGFGGGGGSLEIHAAGNVILTGGRIDASTADPDGDENGGSVSIDSTAGDMTVGIPILANAGAGGIGGDIRLAVPGNVTVNDLGRIAVSGGLGDAGEIEIDAGGRVTLTAASRVQANGIGNTAGFGGGIDVTAGTSGSALVEAIHVDGTIEARGGSDLTGDAGGDGGSISLEAISGALGLFGNGISGDGAGGGAGADLVSLATDSPTTGDITIAAPVSAAGHGTPANRPAGGGQVVIGSARGLTVTRTIDVSGADGGTGTIELTAARDAVIQNSLRGDDPTGGGDLTVESGHDITFTNAFGDTIRMNGTTDGGGPGGSITLGAGNDVRLTGFTFNASGAGPGQGGAIRIDAGGRITVDSATTLNASGGASGRGGTIAVTAGVSADTGLAELPGDLQIDGTLSAIGHDVSGLTPASIQLGGCQVTIGASGRVDSTGDVGSANTVTGRSGITINGRLRATASNTAAYPVGTMPVIGGGAQVSPPFPAPPAGARPLCTQKNPIMPAGCLMPCPVCGNGSQAFPEDCDPPACKTCDLHCRTIPNMCSDGNSCHSSDCDPVLFTCINEPLADRTACDDGNPCTTADACTSGVCTGGPLRNCSDGNICTADRCDRIVNPTTGCVNAPVICPDVPCFQASSCAEPGGCRPGPPVVCGAGLFCNRTTGVCEPKTCNVNGDCDDGNFCTDDTCDLGTHFCSNPPRTGAAPPGCDDANVCDGLETCVSGVCTPGTPLACDDGDVCTMETGCDATGGCQRTPVHGCCHAPADCPGHNLCTSCDANVCGVIPECCLNDTDCDDANECTDDSCSGAGPGVAGTCVHDPAPARACGDACNPGTCLAGTCDSTPVVCQPDTDPCTDDFCDPAAPNPQSPCVHRHREGCCQIDADCDDLDACSVDVCDRMQCFHSELMAECKACGTDQDCAPGFGACAGKRCDGRGVCIDVPPPSCDNPPPNFIGSCVLDAAGNPGCEYRCVRNEACDDHNACNGTETCSAGTCVSGPAPECVDHDLCTDDTCDPATGCPHPQLTGYAGVRCQLDTMDQALNAAAPGDISAGLRGKINRFIGKVRAKLAAGESAGRGRRAVKQLTAAGKQMKAIGKAARAGTQGRKKKIATALANQLIAAATGGGTALDNLKASLLTP